MQEYIADPLVLDRNNKFDFRIYMLVASTNPLLAYYHDGFLRVSLKSYNKTDKHVKNVVLYHVPNSIILLTIRKTCI